MIRRLNHAVLFVADVDRAVSFYTDVLGFVTVTREPRLGAAFLRAAGSVNHHDLGLFPAGGGDAVSGSSRIGLYHLAWQVDTIEDLARLRESIVAAGAFVGESSHGATLSVYGVDPDGIQFEIQWILPRAAWGSYTDRAIVAPLDWEQERSRWSGVATADELGRPPLTPPP